MILHKCIIQNKYLIVISNKIKKIKQFKIVYKVFSLKKI